jgi:putative Mn2+ efflux pump MntP
MNWFIHSLLIFALASQVVPAGISMNVGSNRLKALVATIIMAGMQTLMLALGRLLAGTFMHLIQDWSKGIVFAAFLLTGVRMVMDAFNIRKGKIAYRLEETKFIFLTAIAQSINTFLTGMMFYFFPVVNFETSLIAILLLSTFMMLPAIYTVQSKTSRSFAALLYVAAGIIFTFSAFYLAFSL